MSLPPWLDSTAVLLLGALALLLGAVAWSVLRWWMAQYPVRCLLGRLATEPVTANLFIRGMFVPGNEFFSRAPEYPPGTGGGVTVHKWANIPEVHTASDVCAVADILQLLATSNSRLAFAIRSAEASFSGPNDETIAIGSHHKALQILAMCEPRLIGFRNPDAFRSMVSQEIFEAKPGIDYGLIYKGRHPTSQRAFWVVMGLGDLGTQSAAFFLRTNGGSLARFTGAGPFAAIIAVDNNRGGEAAQLRWLHPRPSWWRRLLFRRRLQELMGRSGSKAS